VSDEHWDVHLEFSDGRSNKFWRARVEDDKLYINFGRIGTTGQTQLKELGDQAAAEKERDKVAKSKRKKGYADLEVTAPEPEPEDDSAPTEPQTLDLALEAEGRKIDLRLTFEGKTVRTTVVEHYGAADTAASTFLRVKKAMLADGYKVVERDDL
jgi:predicted DNA-binding WGR domain protein